MASVPERDSSDDRLSLMRELVVGAALEVLDRDGLGLKAESISYSRVLGHLEEEYGERISRGSVHGRIWDRHEDFRNEVLAVAATHSSPHEDSQRTLQLTVRILRALDEAGLGQRDKVLAFCRAAGRSLLFKYLESDQFRRFQAIKEAARSGGGEEAVKVLRAAVRKNANDNHDERVRTFGLVLTALGLRARPALEVDDTEAIDAFMVMIDMLVTGSHLDHNAGFDAMVSKVETDLPEDADHPWTYFGFGLLAAMDMFFEPDPGASTGQLDYQQELDLLLPDSPSEDRPTLASLISGRPRRSRSELREQVVAAGEELLLRDGLGLEAEALTYATVFAHIKETKGITVHRSTVHQHIWSNQDEFRADVLAEAARYHTLESLQTAKQAMAAQTVARNPDGSVNVRQLILNNTLAIVTAQMNVSASSTSFRRWQSIKASMLSQNAEEHFDQLRQAVNDRYEELVAAFSEVYESTLPLVGLTVNPEMRMSEAQAYHVFSVVGATITSGSDYNISAGATSPNQTLSIRRVDGSGQSDDWPIQAAANLAVLDLLFVPVSGEG